VSFRENFTKFKEGLKGKQKVLEHHQTVYAPERELQEGGQLFGVSLPTFNYKF